MSQAVNILAQRCKIQIVSGTYVANTSVNAISHIEFHSINKKHISTKRNL